VVGAVHVLGCRSTKEPLALLPAREFQFGNFDDGRYWWEFGERFAIPDPARRPIKGHQGFFRLDPADYEWVVTELSAVRRQVLDQLEVC
jgi:hypothetical protein